MPLTILITGASSGIGAALARHYAAHGARLGLVGQRRDALKTLCQALGPQHRYYLADVTDTVGMQAMAASFMADLGTPDYVIANAGVSAGTLTEYAEDLPVFRRIMDINVFGMANTFAPFLPAMKAADTRRADQRLVGIASVAGIRGLPGAEAYSASKAAAITYLESLRLELRPLGIPVITITPGYIDTPMTAHNPYPMPFLLPAPEAARRFARAIQQRRRYCVIPWQMGIVAKLLRLLPNPLYDWLFTQAPRKPRLPN